MSASWSTAIPAALVVITGGSLVALWYARMQFRRTLERLHELERLSLELIRANRMKSEFLANISHELRTPLNAIVGFIELLQDGVYGDLSSRQTVPVDRIQASATHLRHLVDQVLDLAKMAAGRMEVHPESLDLGSFLRDVATEMESLAAEGRLELLVDAASTSTRVSTDPVHLRQILVNLIGNAVKFTERGEVRLSIRCVEGEAKNTDGARAKRWACIEVHDSGIGIREEDQVRIFQEFEQVGAGLQGDSVRRGTGLGLPISKRLALLMGGTITVQSTPGGGSTFALWLPAEGGD